MNSLLMVDRQTRINTAAVVDSTKMKAKMNREFAAMMEEFAEI